MSILFISHHGGLTGAPMVLWQLQDWCRRESTLSFSTLVRTPGPMVERFKALSDQVVAPPEKCNRKAGLKSRLCDRLWKRVETDPLSWVDVCKNHSYRLIYSNTVTNGAVVDRLWKPGTRVITHVHELDYWIENAGKENWERVSRHTDCFIAASSAVAQCLIERYGIHADRIETVHEFIAETDPEFWSQRGAHVREQHGIPADAFLVMASGWEVWRKGRDLLVPLAALVKAKQGSGRPVHFVWVGNQSDQESAHWFHHDAIRMGLADRVHWVDQTPDPFPYFAAADCFAMLSREDPFPLVCLEAAMFSKPILCFSNSGGMPEFVEDDAGFVVPYLDLDAMADRVIQLRDDTLLCQSLGTSASNKVRKNHTVDATAPRIHAIIQKELNQASS